MPETQKYTPVNIYETYVLGNPSFVLISDLSETELAQLALLYMSIFNADNRQLVKAKLIEKGRTQPEGLWNELPWTGESALQQIIKWKDLDRITIVAKDQNQEATTVLGASTARQTNKQFFIDRGLPVPNIQIEEFWYITDTLKRPVGLPLGKTLREKLLNTITQRDGVQFPIYFGARTVNPKMVEIWRKARWNITECPDPKFPIPKRYCGTYLKYEK
ncbi:MAG: hypothetical protein A2427_00355 [Candidatus Nealsonbacteria bacterium RIFOXYC1_FULL_40_7]|uniref:Uncharacterized protein n=1 Tax=Candidatus Nealsonbacteria bacterium RIFOXYC1_FULL_40_7 TaxID=1801678 RepID=A0A1G2EQ66_9BACT|nr:MAG: hypothetical protein A2427_00355 [Candidatus Nealsonbacteria bacterium RIFOXYC1_FULL_40_7]